jgi:isoleucyl-tRNA synthetase
VEYSAKANFRVLGKQLGGKMKLAAAEIAKLDGNLIAQILDGKAVSVKVDGADVPLDTENVIVERKEKENLKVVNDGTLTVGLDTKITDALRKEGYARDLVRGIQNLRKESGFELTDRIQLTVGGDAALKDAFAQFKDFIAGETLAASSEWKDGWNGGVAIDADDAKWFVQIAKA